MTHPTTTQLDALLDAIRITDRRSLTATLHAAIERDRIGGNATPDGYPTSSGNGRRTTGTSSSVETAAARLAPPDRPRHDQRRARHPRGERMTLTLQPSITAGNATVERMIADGNATLAVLATALRRLEDALAGYPSEPGTGPAAAVPAPHQLPAGRVGCPARGCGATHRSATSFLAHWHDEHAPTPSTHPERHALSGADEAARDAAALAKALNGAAVRMLTARRIAEKWGVTKIGAKVTTNPRDDLWCTSCLRARHFTPRRTEGGTVCRWCADTLRGLNAVRAELGLTATDTIPIAAVEKHAAGRTVTANDLTGWARDPTPARRPRRARTQREATAARRDHDIEP